MQELILFPNNKAKNNYLRDKYNYYTMDISNYKTLHQFYKIHFDAFQSNYNRENSKKYADASIAVINLHTALNEYIKHNKNSLISKQNITYELADTLYKTMEEITFAELISNNDKLCYEYDSLKEIKDIISIYKNINNENDLLDQFDTFKLFINAIQNKEIISFNEYNKIIIYNFEKIPPIHTIFLENIAKHYNINIEAVMPYDMSNYFKHYKMFFNSIDNLKSNNISNFSNALIEKKNLNKYKDSIKFIAGFGAKQEADTVVDEIIKLINNGTPLYDIGIVFSNIQKYNEAVSSKLKECGIKFNERRASFLWKVPIIPVLTSIFLILDSYDGEADVDMLIKILSSSYIQNIKGINPYNIRDLIYAPNSEEIFSKMSLNELKIKISKKFSNNKETADSIIEFLNLLNKLVSKKTYKEIGLTYINILKFLKIDSLFTEDENNTNIFNNFYKSKDEYFYRDNQALALFLDFVLKIANTENKEKINHLDFYTALNVLLRDKSLMLSDNRETSVTVSNMYDARGLRFKYLFILGMNNDFLVRRPNTFFISGKLRDAVNKKYSKYIFNTPELLADSSYALFLNIISSCFENTNIYFSFRLKDEDANPELPFYYIEDLYSELYNDDFKFETLQKNGLIYRKDYIPRGKNIHTKKENIMSLFFYNEVEDDIEDLEDIVKTVEHKSQKNGYNNFEDKHEEIKDFFNNIFKNSVSVTTLQAVMECPAKFFHSNLFEKKSVISNVQGISYMEKGITYHNIFQNFYQKVKEQNDSLDCSLKESEFNNYNDIAKQAIETEIERLNALYSKKDLNDRYFIEYQLDQNVIREEALNVMNSFIKKEIRENLIKDEEMGYHYIPYRFEEYIGSKNYEDKNAIIYSNGDFTLKINGRIDRIDFSYEDKNLKKINGIRIVDYKSSYTSEKKKKIDDEIELKKDIINTYFQPILYLKYILSKYIKDDVSDRIKNCEVVFTIYKEKDVVDKNTNINKVYNDRDLLLSICGYIDSNYNLNNYFDEVFNEILNGKLVYKPSDKACSACFNSQYCDFYNGSVSEEEL